MCRSAVGGCACMTKAASGMRCPAITIWKTYLHAYIEGAGIGGNPKNILFPTALGRTGRLSSRPMTQPDAYRMIGRRAVEAIKTKIGNHSFRATGITEYLRNGGRREIAQQMANHESARQPDFMIERTMRFRSIAYHASPIPRLWPCSSSEGRTPRKETGSVFGAEGCCSTSVAVRCELSRLRLQESLPPSLV
jgi:integrase